MKFELSQDKLKILFHASFIYFITTIIIRLSYQNYGFSFDEWIYEKMGLLYLNHGFDQKLIQQTLQHYFGADWKIHYASHGGLLDMAFVWIRKLFFTETIAALHLTKSLVFSLTLPILFILFRQLEFKTLEAYAGVLLLALFPRWTGDIFDNHMDGLSTLLFALGLLLGSSLLKNHQQKFSYLLFGFWCGMAFSHRIVLTTLIMILMPFVFYKNRHNFLKGSIHLLILIATFAVTTYLVDPYIQYQGIQGYFEKISISSNLLKGHFLNSALPAINLFDGIVYNRTKLPSHYLLQWIGISSPILTLLLFIAGSCFLLSRLFKKQYSHQVNFIFICFLNFFLIQGSFALSKPILFNAWRHFLFLVIPLIIIAIFGLREWLNHCNKTMMVLSLIVFALGLLKVGYDTLKLVPYQYLYFNEIVGGVSGAEGKYDLDYWGKTFNESLEYIIKNDPRNIIAVHTCTGSAVTNIYNNHKIKYVPFSEIADYYVCNNNKLQQATTLKKISIYYQIVRNGVTLNTVYKNELTNENLENAIQRGFAENNMLIVKDYAEVLFGRDQQNDVALYQIIISSALLEKWLEALKWSDLALGKGFMNKDVQIIHAQALFKTGQKSAGKAELSILQQTYQDDEMIKELKHEFEK